MSELHFIKDLDLCVKLDNGSISNEDIDFIVNSTQKWSAITEETVDKKLYGGSDEEDEDEYDEDDFDEELDGVLDEEYAEDDYTDNEDSIDSLSSSSVVTELKNALDFGCANKIELLGDPMLSSVLLAYLPYNNCSADRIDNIAVTWAKLSAIERDSILKNRGIKTRTTLNTALNNAVGNETVVDTKTTVYESVELIKKYNIGSTILLKQLESQEGLLFLHRKDAEIKTTILSCLKLEGYTVVSPLRWNSIKDICYDLPESCNLVKYMDSVNVILKYYKEYRSK